MSRTRSFIRQSPALAISLLALVFALGGGAGYAATTTVRPATTLTFRALPLAHHWQAGAHTIAQGEPAYAADGDVVYLSGWLSRSKAPKGIQGVFAVLPPGLRPTHQEDITFTTFAGTTALVQITPDGEMFVTGPNAWQFMSLDGVTFTTNG